MSDLQRVEIREDTENPTIEEQAQPTEETVEDTERPEWLPEKFASAEDMAKAYGELETKLSSPDTEETPEAPPAGLTASDMQTYSDEWAEKGELTDDTYQELQTKYGVDRELVDQYIQGQLSLAQGITEQMHSLAGGQESYGAMIEWAKTSLNESEVKAFDNLMDSGDSGSMEIAIRGLYARYVGDTGGKGPSILQGKTSGGSVNSYRSLAELRTAMGDPRYKIDPAYRKDVEERLAVSNIL